MKEAQLKQLKDILSIPSYVGMEYRVMNYLIQYGKEKGYDVLKDLKGNVYYKKGNIKKDEYYPCVVAHTDTVFEDQISLIEENKRKIIKKHSKKLMAYHPETNERIGIGGDDLAGVFICLQMMEYFDNIKAAFFVEEEIGCHGSDDADPKFFKDVGYVIQFDAPTNDWYTEYLGGIKMYNDDFDKQVKPILEKYNITNYSEDPYTDILALKEKFDFSCANLPAGYHNWHSKDEYVRIDHVENGINMGIDFINKLGLKKQIYIDDNL